MLDPITAKSSTHPWEPASSKWGSLMEEKLNVRTVVDSTYAECLAHGYADL
jgi:hypothetical protein